MKKSLKPADRIPEFSAPDLVRLAKAKFNIPSEPVDDRPHLIRFESDGVSIDLPTHARTNVFDPLSVDRLLRKFHIRREDFCAAYNDLFELPPVD